MAVSFGRFVPAAALVLAVGCGGSQGAAPQAPESGAEVAESPGAPLAPSEALSLSPVSAPAELIVVGRWKDPGATADTVMAWSKLPFDWRRLLQAKEPELSAIVALDAPVDLVVAVDQEGVSRFEQPLLVFSLGLNSLDQALELIRDKGESVRKIQPGVYRIEDGGDLSCVVAASLGPTPARLVCGERVRDVDALLPYATRGLPNESLGGGDIHIELRAESLRREYGGELRQLKSMGLPLKLGELKLGSPRFDRALADAAHGLLDEALALLEDVDRLTLDLNADSSGGVVDVTLGLRFRSESSWTVQTILDGARRSGVAPDLFWRLPGDAKMASFGVSGAPNRSAEIRRTLAELVDGYLAYEKVPRRVRDRFVDIIEDSWVAAGWSVYAQGAVSPAADQDANAADRDRDLLRRVIGWHVIGIEEKPARIKAYLTKLVRAYNDPGLRSVLQSRMNVANSEIPRLVSRRAAARGLSPGSMLYELSLPGKVFSRYSFDTDKVIKGKPLKVHLVLMPDRDATWLGLSADLKVLYEKLALVRKAGRHGTLAARGGLSELKRNAVVSAGYTSLAGLTGSETLALLGEEDTELLELLEKLPHRGETPILFSTTVKRDATTTLSMRLRVEKATFEDVVAAATTAGLGGWQ